MLTKRIIACLDCSRGRVVKGVQFMNLRDAGDPAELAAAHAEAGADEIVLLDISATHEGRGTLVSTVRHTARVLFVPFTVGGGIRTLRDAAAIFDAGADKITINSGAVADPSLITQIAERFGSQAVVVAIDAKRLATDVNRPPTRQGSSETHQGHDADLASSHNLLGDAEVYVSGGRKPTGRLLFPWAKEAESRGAGEILFTSMDRDGTREGFDCELTAAVERVVSIPVIASGGAGSIEHFIEVFRDGHADAALAASIFHFGIHSIGDLKREIQAAGIAMRWPV
ncbi:MAG TPA: imidazole glycerol phosphate synthase subunit HisF [Terriglobales bacterium]|nr:imidazole glycerol phosphate synthase subunit HisF [Terriglobales bacterium]